MEKYQTLIKLILDKDVENSYITYSTDEKGDFIYGRTYVNFVDSEGHIDSISVEVSGDTVKISDVVDTDFSVEQINELANLIKEKSEQQQAIIKKRAWEKLGILNG